MDAFGDGPVQGDVAQRLYSSAHDHMDCILQADAHSPPTPTDSRRRWDLTWENWADLRADTLFTVITSFKNARNIFSKMSVCLSIQRKALSSRSAGSARTGKSSWYRQRPAAHRSERHLQEIPWTQQRGLHGETVMIQLDTSDSTSIESEIPQGSVLVPFYFYCSNLKSARFYDVLIPYCLLPFFYSQTLTCPQTTAAPPPQMRCLTQPQPHRPTCPPSPPLKRRDSRCTHYWMMPLPWCHRPHRAAPGWAG